MARQSVRATSGWVFAVMLSTACGAQEPTPATTTTSGGGLGATGGDGNATAIGGAGGTASEGGAGGAVAQGGSGGEAPIDKAANCADAFGDALTDSYARLDGTVLAVVGPTDTQCPLFNDDHLVIQVLMNGSVYRMVVNVDDILYAEHEGEVVGGPWAEGWHTDVTLEYPTLGVHSDAFAPHSMTELVDIVTDAIDLDAPISVYAVSSGGEFASSAHLVHRNNSQPDGAILVNPTSANPRYLLFRFDNQQF